MASLDRIFDLLSDEQRRYALYYLDRQDDPVPVDELADVVAEWQDDPPQTDARLDRYEKIEMRLHHQHLPKAAEAEFIEYDRERGVVEVSGTPSEVEAVLTVAELVENPASAE
jgi:hypothetical protein